MAEASLIYEKEHGTMIDWLSLFVYSHISSTLSYAVCVCYVTAVVPDSSQPHGLACRAPLSMEFSRQEYWRGLPCPSLGDLPNPGVKPVSLMFPALAGRFFTTSATWEAQITGYPKVWKVGNLYSSAWSHLLSHKVIWLVLCDLVL